MIKFVYFDVGGVLVKDYSCTNNWEQMKSGMGVTQDNSDEFEKIWNQYAEERACLDYDVDKLIPVIKDKLCLNIPDDYSLLQDFVNRFDRNEGIWKTVAKAKKTCKVGLLTNMYPRMLSMIDEAKLLDEVDWDTIIDSSQIKLQKPSKEIFQHAQKAAQVEAGQILFIDNSRSHLTAAEELGWQIYHYDSCDYDKSNQDLATYFANI